MVGCASAHEVYDMGVNWPPQTHWYEPGPELKGAMYFLVPAVQKVEEYQSKNNVISVSSVAIFKTLKK